MPLAFLAPAGSVAQLPIAGPALYGARAAPTLAAASGVGAADVAGVASYGGYAALAAAFVGAGAGRRRKAKGAGARLVALEASVGERVPGVSLDRGFPPKPVPLAEYCKGKKVVLVGLPGAFTPTWSTTQVPGYLSRQEELKAKGVSSVLVYCVNDGAVMTAWAREQGVEGSIIEFLGDPRSELTQALDMTLDHPGPMSVLGNPRCKRFSMLIDDGIIKTINVAASEEDPAGDGNPTVTLVEKMLADLEIL